MSNPFRRIFGLGPSRQAAKPAEVYYDNGQGTRMIMAQDTSAEAVAARHNFAAIYGEANMPSSFTMKPVVQVFDKGEWQNVTGRSYVPGDIATQLGALQAYQATGIIGPQPFRENGAMATANGVIGRSSPSNFGPAGSRSAGGDPLAMPVAVDQLTPEAAAFLNATSLGESGGRYDIRYDGGAGSTFALNGKHPRIFVPTADGDVSSAAGRYQITASTWDDITGGNVPFTEANQDIYAWKIAQRDYKARTGKDLQKELQTRGLAPDIMQTMGPTWSAYKNQQSYGDYQAAYNNTLTGAASRSGQNLAPSLIGNDTTTSGSDFGMLARPEGRFTDAKAPLLIQPQVTRGPASGSDMSALFGTPTLADQMPSMPSLIAPAPKQQKAPTLITPGKNF